MTPYSPFTTAGSVRGKTSQPLFRFGSGVLRGDAIQLYTILNNKGISF